MSEKENMGNMINIRTQVRDSSTLNAPNDISFAYKDQIGLDTVSDTQVYPSKLTVSSSRNPYDSIEAFHSKPSGVELDDSIGKMSTSKFPIQSQSGGNTGDLLKRRVKVRKMSLYMKKDQLFKKKIRKNYAPTAIVTSAINSRKLKKSPLTKKLKSNKEKEDNKTTDLPLQVAPEMEDRCRPSMQIHSIIKDTIKKQFVEKLKREKEEELKKESQENMKKKLDKMNEEIRKANLLRNDKYKHRNADINGEARTANGMPFKLIPWGGDQTQFQQETIDQPSLKSKGRRAGTPSPFRNTLQEKYQKSASKSEKADMGMDFLDFRPKIKKKKLNWRKHSLQDTSNARRIEIEEKDSIEFKKNKVSIENFKKTVIYNKTDKRRNSNTYAPLKVTNNPTAYELFKKHKEDALRQSHTRTKRSKSARSSSRKRDYSDHSQKEEYNYMKGQEKRHKSKEKKGQKVSSKLKYDRNYDGLIPKHLSKHLKKKSERSKTPRSKVKKNQLSFTNGVYDKIQSRPGTASNFYPDAAQQFNDLKVSIARDDKLP